MMETESQLRAKLARVKAIKEWLWVGIIICILALASLPLFAFPQDPCCRYTVGIMSSSSGEFPIAGEIVLTDSIATFTLSGKTATYKVANAANGNIYITDGTMTHTVIVFKETGRVKRFDYNARIFFRSDQNLGGAIANYYCRQN
jgi:hypothetical protein